MFRHIHRSTLILVAAAVMQCGLAFEVRDIKPSWGILPDVPDEHALDVLAFGDRQLLYRYLALQLQNAGDNGGRITPLRNYDYANVVRWLNVLDELDMQSHWAIAMANSYFGQTPKTEDVEPIVRYMQRHVARNPDGKWPWLTNAIYLSRHRLRNDWVALDVAEQLATYDYANMNAWSLQMPALVLDDLGQMDRALARINDLMARRGAEFRSEERAWMDSYLAEHAGGAAGAGGGP